MNTAPKPAWAKIRSNSRLRYSRVISSRAPNGSSKKNRGGSRVRDLARETPHLHATRQGGGIMAVEPAQSHQFDGFFCSPASLAPIEPAQFAEEFHVLLNGSPGQEGRVLENVPQVPLGPAHFAGADREETRTHSEQCGLSATGGADHRHELAGFHPEADIVHRMGAVGEGLADVFEGDEGGGRTAAPRVSMIRGLGV